MNRYKIILPLLCLPLLLSAQDGEWIGIPGLNGNGIQLNDQPSFLRVITAATLSYGLSEWVLQEEKDLHFYQVRTGLIGTTRGTVLLENFGIEARLAPWFGLGIEWNTQQWLYPEKNGWGMGIMSFYRWHLFGRKRFSPYLEYGAGLFHGFSKFPPEGTQFTFNLSSQLGVEYTLPNEHKLRLSYGHLHQSNNGLLDPNPGEDGNGFHLTYLWRWGKPK